MTIRVNLQEAEQRFRQLISQVIEGEEIALVSDGEEMARLVPSPATRKNSDRNTSDARVPGIDKGRFVVPDDFDDPLPPDVLAAFEGKS